MSAAAGNLIRRARVYLLRNGLDPDEVDPTFEEEFAAFRALWPGFYKQDTPNRT